MPAVGDEITPDGHPGGPDVVCTVDTVPVYATLDPDETFTTYSFMQTCTRETPPQNNLCPAPNTALRNTAMQEVLFTGTVHVPPLMPLRQAFRNLEIGFPNGADIKLFEISSELRNAFLLNNDPNTDKQWMLDNEGNIGTQLEERQSALHSNASVLIEITPTLWNDLPPGGDELLEALSVIKD